MASDFVHLSKGSYGDVNYNVKNNTVVKIMDKFNDKDKSMYENTTLKELVILSQIESPYIIGLKDVSIKPDKIKLYLDYGGHTLFDYLNNTVALGIEDRINNFLNVFYQLTLAVKSLHDLGISHGDLKPSNIVVGQNYNKVRLRLIDLGGIKLDNIYVVNTCSYAYMAPEASLSKKYGLSNDIWAIGIIMLEYLTNIYGIAMLDKFYDCLNDGGVNEDGGNENGNNGDGNKKNGGEEDAVDEDEIEVDILSLCSNDEIYGKDKTYIKNIFTKLESTWPTTLRQVCEEINAPVEYLVLLEKIMTFNPDNRLTIDELYENEIFSTLRLQCPYIRNKWHFYKTPIRLISDRTRYIEIIYTILDSIDYLSIFVHTVCLFDTNVLTFLDRINYVAMAAIHISSCLLTNYPIELAVLLEGMNDFDTRECTGGTLVVRETLTDTIDMILATQYLYTDTYDIKLRKINRVVDYTVCKDILLGCMYDEDKFPDIYEKSIEST